MRYGSINVHVFHWQKEAPLSHWYQAAMVTFFPLIVWRTLPFEWLRYWDRPTPRKQTKKNLRNVAFRSEMGDKSPQEIGDFGFRYGLRWI